MSENLYFIAESGDVLTALEKWRSDYVAARVGYFTFAKSKGAAGIFCGGLDDSLFGLTPVDPVPPGWKVQNRRRRSDGKWMLPIRDKDGEAARAELAALPKPPTQYEAAKIIGHPEVVNYRYEGGHGSTSLGFFHAVYVFFPSGDGPILLQAGNPEYVISKLRAQHPDVIIEKGEWTPPPGLRLLTEAEKDLIVAQDRVRVERLDKKESADG